MHTKALKNSSTSIKMPKMTPLSTNGPVESYFLTPPIFTNIQPLNATNKTSHPTIETQIIAATTSEMATQMTTRATTTFPDIRPIIQNSPSGADMQMNSIYYAVIFFILVKIFE